MKSIRWWQACIVLGLMLAPALGVRALEPAPNFQRVMIVVLENAEYDAAIEQPFFKTLIRRGGLLTDYHAVGHPSEPNYLALVSGSTFGVVDDGEHDLDGRHIGDLLEAHGKSWKAYAEGYPGNNFQGRRQGLYWRKHEPFISFKNMQGADRSNAHLVPAEQLEGDIQGGRLPDYSLYVPDADDDGHDTGIVYADKWLARAFGPRLRDPAFMQGMLFIVTYDESNLYVGDNHIATVLVGDSVRPGSVSNTFYYHYSIVRTIEDAWSLGTLDQEDATSPAITGIWR